MNSRMKKMLQILFMILVTAAVIWIVYQNVDEGKLATVLLLLAYFLWNLWNMNQLRKSRAEAVHELERNNVLIDCVTELSSREDADQAVNNLLKIVTEYFKGDRTYIFDVDYEEKLIHNTFEYASEGVTKEIDNLRNVPLGVVKNWITMFDERGMFYISNLDAEKGQGDPRTYDILKAQNINSLIAVPLKKDGKVTGFFGVDNPREHYRDFQLLASIQLFIMNRLENKTRQEQLQYLGYRDMLTNLYNRNRYMKMLEAYRGANFKNIGVVYIDLNGLKQVNDEQGHEAGDSFIRRAAQQIVAVFPEHTYRIGGDEFVVIYPDILEQQFEFLMSQLKLNTLQHHISLSVGAVWREECDALDALLKEADAKMYEDKKKYYEKKGHDRRKNPRPEVKAAETENAE